MKAGEESSWERLIAEQNRQLEDYREKAAKVEEKLKSYKRTIAHEERQITSNSGNPAAAAAAKRRKKAAEAKAIPVMKRWKTFNRNIEKIQERRRGIYAKIEEQRKAKRVARDAQRASASQRYASQTMETLGTLSKPAEIGKVPRGKGRGKKSKSPSRSKSKVAATSTRPRAESEDEEKAGTVDKGTGKGRGRGRRRSSSRSKSKAAAASTRPRAESEDEEKAGTVDKGTGKGRGRGRRRSSSRSKSKAAAATAAATAALFPEGRLPSTRGLSPEWEQSGSFVTMGRSTPESEEIQNLAKSPFAQGEAGSDRGWDITTLDNQFPRPQDISLADIPEALGRIIIVEHAVRDDFERRQEQLRRRGTKAADNALRKLEARYTPVMKKIKEIQRIVNERNQAIGDVVARPGEEVDPDVEQEYAELQARQDAMTDEERAEEKRREAEEAEGERAAAALKIQKWKRQKKAKKEVAARRAAVLSTLALSISLSYFLNNFFLTRRLRIDACIFGTAARLAATSFFAFFCRFHFCILRAAAALSPSASSASRLFSSALSSSVIASCRACNSAYSCSTSGSTSSPGRATTSPIAWFRSFTIL